MKYDSKGKGQSNIRMLPRWADGSGQLPWPQKGTGVSAQVLAIQTACGFHRSANKSQATKVNFLDISISSDKNKRLGLVLVV
mmetsp:Transcript_50433/g.93209  ORF Transcript_50433/g.93209 Transcript_50433/m.93209 type:complete len:82 (-) Transcript_50433:1412-1657(-)